MKVTICNTMCKTEQYTYNIPTGHYLNYFLLLNKQYDYHISKLAEYV